MKELEITAKVDIYNYDELSIAEKSLINKAKEETQKAYAPYSHFRVGAALLLKNGVVVTGSNQENAAYPSGLCAERTAIFYANAQYPDIAPEVLAIAAFTNGTFLKDCVSPCGACRQVILEVENRYKQPITILLYGEDEVYKIKSIRDLLPLCFEQKSLQSQTIFDHQSI